MLFVIIAIRYNQEILILAVLFKNTGFIETYHGYEDISVQLATSFLKKNEYPDKRIEKVINCIEATKVNVQPKNLLQKIIKDANNVAYQQNDEALRHEWAVFKNKHFTDKEWLENLFGIWNNHQFYTGEGQMLFGKTKKDNLKRIAKDIKKLESSEKGNLSDIQSILEGNKSAQMIFKTTLRNHIDLTSIADNKSNMMLSISALIITIAMPLLAGNLEESPFLLLPITLLILTCVLCIVFATIATQPVKTTGKTDLSKISKGETNLFFYGNFHKMNLDEYIKGIREVSSDDNILDNSIVRDLFFLGKALGEKFHLLRRCYIVFMVGMILTVISFALSFILLKGGI